MWYTRKYFLKTQCVTHNIYWSLRLNEQVSGQATFPQYWWISKYSPTETIRKCREDKIFIIKKILSATLTWVNEHKCASAWQRIRAAKWVWTDKSLSTWENNHCITDEWQTTLLKHQRIIVYSCGTRLMHCGFQFTWLEIFKKIFFNLCWNSHFLFDRIHQKITRDSFGKTL